MASTTVGVLGSLVMRGLYPEEPIQEDDFPPVDIEWEEPHYVDWVDYADKMVMDGDTHPLH